MADQCLFCKIVRKEIPAKIVEETDDMIAFRRTDRVPLHILAAQQRPRGERHIRGENLPDRNSRVAPHHIDGSKPGNDDRDGKQASDDTL